MNGYGKALKATLVAAEQEAREDGSSTVEAQHVLLALSSSEDPGLQRVMDAAGLNETGLREALAREFEQSLDTAGVSLAESGIPRPRHPRRESLGLGSSVKLAFERGAVVAGQEELRLEHLLMGIVQAPVGTVPRALSLAGVDPSSVAEAARRSLAEGSEPSKQP